MQRSWTTAALALAVTGFCVSTTADTGAARAETFWDQLGASIGYGRADSSHYSSEGFASRLRWEPLEYFGLDLTSEFLSTEGEGEAAGAKAFDIPIGFHLYVPVELGWGVRVRALAGLCVDISLARSATVTAPPKDDVSFGFRLGGGAEVALSERFWAFADAKWERYLGHGEQDRVWSTSFSGALDVTDRLAIAIGLGMNL